MGDHLVRDAYPFLQNQQAAFRHGDKTYLQSTYDTFSYFPVFTESNPLSMVRSAVIEGFNRRKRFPNAIVILMGDLLLLQDPLFLPSELERKIRWIMREVTTIITTMKSLVNPKSFTFGEPRIIWVRSFQTTAGNPIPMENLLKFNNILRRVCATKAIYTPDLKWFTSSTARCYDKRGRICDSSFKELWLALSDMIKHTDERDEHYYINKKVEERLKELKNEGELKFERKASTYLAVTGRKTFTDSGVTAHANHRERSPSRSREQHRDHRRERYSRSGHRRHLPQDIKPEYSHRQHDYRNHHHSY